jgi:hypothetical protein
VQQFVVLLFEFLLLDLLGVLVCTCLRAVRSLAVTRKSPSASGSAKTRKSEALTAMERGEVEGFCAMGWNELKQRHTPWMTEKKVNILFQRGLDKDEELPNVPLIL